MKNKTEHLALKHELEEWLVNEWMFESRHLYSLYCKTFELAKLFPFAKHVLVKILSEENVRDGSMIYFVRKFEGLSSSYDYKHLYEELCELTEEIKMGF